MKYYCLRDKETGEYMPLLKRNVGYTYWNPGDEDNGIIRFFKSERAARIASSIWCSGEIRTEYGNCGEFSLECDTYLTQKKVDNRYKCRLEVVPVTVSIGDS